MKKSHIPLILLTLAAIIILLLLAYKNQQKPLKVLKVYGNPGHFIGAFSFTDHHGTSFTDKNLEGRIAVVDFFFTQCQSICPKMNHQLQRIDSIYKSQSDFLILSHTVKPEEDSVNILAALALQLKASPRWIFLTGEKNQLYKTARSSYLLDVDGVPDFVHTSFVCLVDRHKRLRGFYDATKSGDMDKLIIDIQILLDDTNQ